MRITGGDVKGRMLKFPSGSVQRPTSDFLRQALFNILESPEERFFLDIFAGSGAVGLEAASRKASSVVFVEKSKTLAGVIRDNIASCGFHDVCEVFHGDFRSVLRDLYEKRMRYDLIFADPPYNRGFVGDTVNALSRYPLLHEGGVIVFQHSIRESMPRLPDGWLISDQRIYGDNSLTFIRMGVT